MAIRTRRQSRSRPSDGSDKSKRSGFRLGDEGLTACTGGLGFRGLGFRV